MIQGGEILIILLVALIVLGPRRLPEIARKMGRWAVELRQAAREITQGLEAEVADIKEAGKELKEAEKELRQRGREITRDLKVEIDDAKEVERDLRKQVEELKDLQDGAGPAASNRYEWTGPKPLSGPTPEDAMADLEELEDLEEDTGGDKAV